MVLCFPPLKLVVIRTTLWLKVAASEEEPPAPPAPPAPPVVLGVAMVERLPFREVVLRSGLVRDAGGRSVTVVAGATEEAVELTVKIVATVGTGVMDVMAEVGGGDCGAPALSAWERTRGRRERRLVAVEKCIFEGCSMLFNVVKLVCLELFLE